MPRLIDADALLKVPNVLLVCEYDETGEFISYLAVPVDAIKNAPTIEAEPVVHCEDCVCCSAWNDELVCTMISNVMDGYYHGTAYVVKPDDYCSRGIRKRAKPCNAKMDGGMEND